MKTLILFISIALSLGMTGCETTTAKGSKPPLSTPTPAPAPAKSLTLVLDKTGSGSFAGFDSFAENLTEALTATEGLTQIEVINIAINGESTWLSEVKRFDLPASPTLVFDEEQERAVAKKICSNRIECINDRVSKARKAAETLYEGKKATYESDRATVIQKVLDLVVLEPTNAAACTDVQEQAERTAQAPSLVVWVTDGQHTCKTAYNGIQLRPGTLIGLLPLRDEQPGEFGIRQAGLSAKFPGIKVKPFPSISKATLIEFLK